MNRQQFNDWLKDNDACPDAVKWCNEHPDLSVQELMSICPRGAYRAAERALGHTTDALDRAGVPHGLHGLVITDAESARAAAGVAAGVAEWAAEVTEAAARAAWVAALAAAQEKKMGKND